MGQDRWQKKKVTKIKEILEKQDVGRCLLKLVNGKCFFVTVDICFTIDKKFCACHNIVFSFGRPDIDCKNDEIHRKEISRKILKHILQPFSMHIFPNIYFFRMLIFT